MEFMLFIISNFKGLENSEKIDRAKYMKDTIDMILEIALKDNSSEINTTHRAKNKY